MGNSQLDKGRAHEEVPMPWERATVTEQKVEFVRGYYANVKTKEISMKELCKAHGISRKGGYAAVAAFEQRGWPGLAGKSRAPHDGKHWAEPEVILSVLDTREEFPEWGAKKIVTYLSELEPDRHWPAASVAHEWIRKAGMVRPRVRARRFSHPGKPPAVVIDHPNQRWSVDFKGHFRTQDRRYCYPLTVADSFSRYVLGCEALLSTSFDLAWPVFERLFREYGLPETILSDNGSPFSSMSVRRLSKFAVRLMRLGISPMLTEPGKPQQNGRHERMHRDLKAIACANPSTTCAAQQKQFDRFLHRFNMLRPHEALEQTPPARSYKPSPRPYPRRIPEITYPAGLEIRHVRSSGEIRWDGQFLFLSEALVGETVAFELVDNDCWIIKYSTLELGYYSGREKKLHLDRPRPDGKAENK
jgi:transposase InsO family protein